MSILAPLPFPALVTLFARDVWCMIWGHQLVGEVALRGEKGYPDKMSDFSRVSQAIWRLITPSNLAV